MGKVNLLFAVLQENYKHEKYTEQIRKKLFFRNILNKRKMLCIENLTLSIVLR